MECGYNVFLSKLFPDKEPESMISTFGFLRRRYLDLPRFPEARFCVDETPSMSSTDCARKAK